MKTSARPACFGCDRDQPCDLQPVVLGFEDLGGAGCAGTREQDRARHGQASQDLLHRCYAPVVVRLVTDRDPFRAVQETATGYFIWRGPHPSSIAIASLGEPPDRNTLR